MNVAIYTRVSTQQQAEHGYSIEEQENACRKKALELGATSIKVYRDSGFSGAYLERPALDDLRDAVAQKLHDCIVIYDIDRLSRDTMHLLLLTEEMEKNAQLVYVNSEYSRTGRGHQNQCAQRYRCTIFPLPQTGYLPVWQGDSG